MRPINFPWWVAALCCALSLGVLGGCRAGHPTMLADHNPASERDQRAARLGSHASPSAEPRSLVDRLVPSTVTILALREHLRGEGVTSTESQGSGFVIDVDGRHAIATANHVVEGATEIVVYHPSGARFDVSAVLARDLDADVAVLEVPDLPRTVRALPLGRVPELGGRVVLVSTPLGLDETVAFGSVAATRRSHRAFQVAAGVAPGSSGGLVSDPGGRAVGVIRAKATVESGGDDITLVTPMRYVSRALKRQKRMPLTPAPEPRAMQVTAHEQRRAEASGDLPWHRAVARFEFSGLSGIANHVCLKSEHDESVVVLAEKSRGAHTDWRVGVGTACATFAKGRSWVAWVGATRAGHWVNVTVRRQPENRK